MLDILFGESKQSAVKGALASYSFAKYGCAIIQIISQLSNDKMDVRSFPWWSQTYNVTWGERSLATLKIFKHGCLCTLKTV